MRSCAPAIFICFENWRKKAQVQFFLVFLPVPFQTGWSRFYLVGLLDLIPEQTIDRAVRGAVSIGRKDVLDYVWSSNLITFLDPSADLLAVRLSEIVKTKNVFNLVVYQLFAILTIWFSCIWSLWIPLAAFNCRIWGNSSHTTTTGSGRSWFASILVYRLVLKRLIWSATAQIWYLILVVWMQSTITSIW